MIPNMINAAPMPMQAPTGVNPLPTAMPTGAAPETAGFNFESYLLGLQAKATAVEGAIDWKALLQADGLIQNAPATGDKETATPNMDALAALFAVPANLPMQVAPVQTDVNAVAPTLALTKDLSGLQPAKMMQPMPNTQTVQNLANQQLQLTPQAKVEQSTKAVDWKALGMTQVTPESIQNQGWDAKQVEQLFATRTQDLSDMHTEVALPVDAKVLSVQGQPEKVQAFQQQPLTAHQPVIQMSEGQRKPETTVSAERQPIAPTGETVASKVEGKDRLKPEIRDSKEFAAFNTLSGDSTPTVKPSTTVAATGPVIAATASESAAKPQWVTSAESLASQGGGKMTIALSPPELGKVEIEVTTRGKNVEVEMRSESEGAKKILQGGMSELKSALMGHDLVLSRSEVKVSSMDRSAFDGFSSQAFQNNYSSADRQQSQGNPSNGNSERQSRWDFAQSQLSPKQASVVRTPSSISGRIDVRI